MIALSNVTNSDNAALWPQINKHHKGAANLVHILENYLVNISTNLPGAQSNPFEAVSDGIGES